ncbi:Inner membrane protein YbaN [Aliiroseovarius pelagivivens]|uniref:Inner membrane protein YbaN n=1 Tax=Aliiroseovarius pelagivivens TaxID=1639690 RepID=A0A2R8AIJ7_9RHOB|nr:YbaN family protein [Aliiroseovarius pelagivivens]SPF75848.1 Inner membrane protein YbaN [Aliiroseovarius pelagivivens]
MGKFFYLALGWSAVALGLLGVILPVLPTTPFLLVAAFAFGNSSPRARAWLIDHAHFGPAIRDWEERGAISRRAKTLAVSMMTLVLVVSLILGAPWWVVLAQVLLMGAGAAFILTRPD